MSGIPRSVAEFLDGRRIAVAGVSRDPRQPANAILARLRACGHEVVPLNPNAPELDGLPCFPDLRSIPGVVDGLMVVTHPAVAAELVRQAADRGVRRLWFHRAIGAGSVSEEALAECRSLGLEPIVGGCPLMYCPPVDPFHRCLRFILRWGRRVPG